MKIVCISDTHTKHQEVILPKGDLLIHAGDVSWVGSELQLIDFFKWFDKQDFKHKIFIAGNHDLMFERNPKQAQSLIPKSIIYLEESSVTIEGIKIYGTPITPYFFNWAFNRYPGQDIEQHTQKIPNDTDILITHGPPYGILDANVKGEHCGCPSLLSKIQEVKPKLLICGHIHEGYGRLQKEESLYINASLLNHRYEYKNSPVVVEL
ncbi:MAG: metallophosphatase domain-containing protein [Cyclobacteriaceae bacterium]|mgnify:CR=1 FL=1|nr:metallophosphatase domain-containing protein [Cyclobacteriaceae bacterium]HRJ31311.1 metallophosphatase domain-containing protein [Cyclobacteriaceae bacterium]HRJ81227.1 metallophosphatase domain-containing protein [Cyclobacteriaceae bacterium]